MDDNDFKAQFPFTIIQGGGSKETEELTKDIRGKQEKIPDGSTPLKCKFCSSPVLPHYKPNGEIDSYYCGCEGFKNYLIYSIALQKLDNEYNQRRADIVSKRTQTAQESDFYKKVTGLIQYDRERDTEADRAKMGMKIIDLTKFISSKEGHEKLQKEIEEYYWYPNI